MIFTTAPRAAAWLPLSAQHLFAMFGATILVPFLTGLHPSVALVSSGIGTLLYIALTKAQIPAYLGSSFAFITPIIVATQLAGGLRGDGGGDDRRSGVCGGGLFHPHLGH